MSVGLLDFFILEASDHAERLDALLGSAGPDGPDPAELTKLARGLRGSATMAKVRGIAELAASIERVGRELHGHRARWSSELAAALVGAVDELKALLHAVRAWGPEQDARTEARIDAIVALVPAARITTSTPTFGGGVSFVAEQGAGIAAVLEAMVADPGNHALVGELLRLVRGLRGVAAVKDVPPVAEVADAVERAARPLEIGGGTATAAQRELFAAAAALLRRVADIVRAGDQLPAGCP
jgi:HPt (histidine-containing phosphotransfer) domain-containing protein